jgi:predicted ArsR family transcriptional regulator
MLSLSRRSVNGLAPSTAHPPISFDPVATRLRVVERGGQRGPDPAAVDAVACLADPVRRSLFDAVVREPAALTREQAAAAVGVSRRLAAFHLDKLVTAGLLEVGTAPAGRVGRRPRVYRPASGDVTVSIPQRRPQLLARLLLAALAEQHSGEDGPAAALRVSRARGRAVGADERSRLRPGRLGAERALTLLRALLERLGYEPTAQPGDRLGFATCPFHPLAADAPELVCGIHHAYVSGLVDGLEAAALETHLRPGTGGCCVEVRAAR